MASQPETQAEAQQEMVQRSSVASEHGHPPAPVPEGLARSQSASSTGSGDQISQAPTNSTLVMTPNGNLSPLLTEEPFRVGVKKLGSEADSITSVTPSDNNSPPAVKGSPLIDVETAPPNEKKPHQTKKRLNIQWTSSNHDESQPSIYWYYPVSMVVLTLGGFFGALGHHLYNQGLKGTEVQDAAWPQRWGIALAFFIKMMLAAAVQVAFKQVAWLTVKRRAFKIKTLDSIFHICYDPMEFLDKDLLRGAILPAVLAGLIWLLPLSAIATPSTLTLSSGFKTFPGTCANVSHLNFRKENGFDMNGWDRSQDKNGMSFWDQFENTTSFYNAPSMDLRRIFRLAMLSTNPIQPDRGWSLDPVYVNPLQQHNPCPVNSNCTFSVSFFAPSYKCEERDEFGDTSTFKKSDLVPYGDLIYVSYSSTDGIEDDAGRPRYWDTDHPNNDTGVWKEEPTLWFGYIWNTTKTATAENATQWNTTTWATQYTPHIIACSLHNATYHITLSFLDNMQAIDSYRIEFGPLLLPPGEVMRPIDPTYMEFSGFHASGKLYRKQLAGNVTQNSDANVDWAYAVTNSDISETDITDPGNGLPHEEALGPYIEAGFQSIYLAMLSDMKQYAQFDQPTPCNITETVLVWDYTPMWLAISYCIAVGLTLVAVAVGFYAMALNGYVARTTFSTFLATTRNVQLDGVDWGSSLGTLPLKKEVSETVLMFGETVHSGISTGNQVVPHAAFGFPEGIRKIRRGQQYE